MKRLVEKQTGKGDSRTGLGSESLAVFELSAAPAVEKMNQ
jgi:hypothetical protein